MNKYLFRFLISAGALLCASAIWTHIAPAQAAASRHVDLLIAHGKLFDGSGSEPTVGDVGIQGDRIVFIGDAAKSGVSAVRVINASGLDVAPGFIDPHIHTFDDLTNVQRHANVGYLMQGVTTVITGNDGSGPLPIGSALKNWDEQGIGTNAALLVGMCSVRRQVMGMSDSAPAAAQLTQMKQLVAEGMDDGAFGMSAGLFYAPCSFATTEEVIELAKIAAAKHGYYDTHMRDESSYSIGLLGSIRETIRIGREAQIPVHISHIKALGPQVWGKSTDAIAMIKRAQGEGIKVTADQYPYEASGSSLDAALIPHDVQILPAEQLLLLAVPPKDGKSAISLSDQTNAENPERAKV